LQSRDGLTDNLAPTYSDRSVIIGEPRPYSLSRRTLALIAAWLIPGAGHLVLGRFGRALLFFVTIVGSFALGLALNGRLFWPTPNETQAFPYYDLITVLWFFAQIGSGLCYIIAYVLGIGTIPIPEAATFEYGNTFMFLAGLLNYLVMHDAFDIGAGRKR
jgi:Family of unknown function (DUF6677)